MGKYYHRSETRKTGRGAKRKQRVKGVFFRLRRKKTKIKFPVSPHGKREKRTLVSSSRK